MAVETRQRRNAGCRCRVLNLGQVRPRASFSRRAHELIFSARQACAVVMVLLSFLAEAKEPMNEIKTDLLLKLACDLDFD